MIATQDLFAALDETDVFCASGVVLRVVGLAVVASGPGLPVGDTCTIATARGGILAVVSGFREGEIILQPLGSTEGIRSGDRVVALGGPLRVPVGPGLIGRIIDGTGQPLDGRGPVLGSARRSVQAEPPPALDRQPIERILETGIRSIDALFPIGYGQRMGIFAGSGVGKSTLLAELARGAKADVNVIALVGERGREVGEFVNKVLGPEGLARSVVIASTSDRPAVERFTAACAAHAVAEHFRDAGLQVVLMMDSVTRLCHAAREIGLANGEAPVARGYPPSAFAVLPKLLERAGTAAGSGSITAFYTVLIEADDENDPVGDTVRGIIDGHLFLSRRMAGQAIYPAIDPTASVSRLAVDLCTSSDYRLGLLARERLSEYERIRDLVEVGAYKAGADPRADAAITAHPKLLDFLRQSVGERHTREAALSTLRGIVGTPS